MALMNGEPEENCAISVKTLKLKKDVRSKLMKHLMPDYSDFQKKQTEEVTVGIYRETTCARCDGCGFHLRSLSAGGCTVPLASYLPPFESVQCEMT